jgi:hypothetical protein
MKAAVEAFKKQFTTGFYHGSPSPNIKEFDPTKSAKDPMYTTPKATFVTRDPEFAESFLSMNNSGKVKSGSTMYPVSVNLGQHWNPGTPEGQEVIQEFIAQYPKRVNLEKGLKRGDWTAIENSDFLEHLKNTGHDTFHVVEGGIPNVGVLKPQNIRGKFAEYNPEEAANPDFMKAEGGAVEGYDLGGKVKAAAKLAKKSHSQDPRVAQALEEYLKGNISQEERIRIMNQFLPARKWSELPPNYTDEQIRNALMSNKQEKALAPVPAGMRVGNRLDIPAYTQNGVYVDTTHALTGGKSPISYNRTGHLKDVEFSSKPDKAVRVGLGTQPQALTPMAAEYGADKSPFALIQGTNIGTKDDEVRRMMEEMMRDPRYTQIGMDPRRHSQFYDKETGMPVFAAEEKLQSGPLILAPKQGLETTSWDDPRLNLSDFEGKKYAAGGNVVKAAKKMLEHARSVPFVHFSNKADLMQLDPNMYGTGIKGQEAARLKNAPDIKPRSYIYTDRPDVRPEQGLGSHKYSGVAEDMYPLHEDPAGYSAIAKMKAIDPYLMSMGREVIDQPTHLNELERLIKAAGYKGYANDDVGLLFHPTEVKKISGPEHFADGGSVQHFLFGGSVDAVGPTIGPAQVPGVAGTLATTETPVGLLPSNLNDFVTGGGKFNPTTGLPSNYQEARTAFDQQQQAERAKNPFGNVSATVVGNDQFGQQFGYAADADAFNQFYNKNYGASAPAIAPEYKTGSPPVTTATGDSSFNNTNLGGLSGALAGNNPATPTVPAIINSTTSQLPSNWQQTYTGPSAAMVGWQPNTQQYAANNTAGFTLPTKPVSTPVPTTGGGLSSLIPAKPTVKPQLPPSSPVFAATLPPPKVNFRNTMKPVAMAANPVRQRPVVKPMFSRTNFFKKR